MKSPFLPQSLFKLAAAFVLSFASVASFATPSLAADYNEEILAQVKAMPQGGLYAANRLATLRLQASAHVENGKFCVMPGSASPSYCSGATYLVFLKTIESLRGEGRLALDSPALAALLIHGQPDGSGIWGRWNANGPGTARLFHELGLGRNFEDFSEARPGDFMKIFWSSEVGKLEHGHSVVFLGLEMVKGVENVRFWSSNIPGGYGEKSVPRTKVAYAIFSRLEHPEALDKFSAIPPTDPYLHELISVRSSIMEARLKTGI